MKKKLFLSLSVLTIVWAGCSNEDFDSIYVNNDKVEAVIADVSSRTTMNGNRVVWETTDSISIFALNGNAYSNNGYKLESGNGTTSATFTGSYEGTAKVAALYPYQRDASYSASAITLSMPATYSYAENANNEAPMAGLYENSSISFKNAGALMCITVNNIPAGYTKATLTSLGENAKAITGAAEITFTEGVPTLKMASGANGTSIDVTFEVSSEVTNKTFYFPLPVDNYESLQISVGNDSETKILKTKALNVSRNVRYTTTLTIDNQDVTIEQTVDSEAKLAAALKEGGNVTLDAPITLQGNLSVDDNTIIDLNGQTLNTGSNTITVAAGKSLTINDSKVSSTMSLLSRSAGISIIGTGDIITASANSIITIGEGVNLTTSGANSCCIFVPGSDRNNIANGVTINTAGNLTATTAGAGVIYVNGNVTSGTINITGGSVKHSEDVAVYIAGKVNLNVSEGAVIEGITGIEMRAGELIVNGGSIKGTGNPFDSAGNGNGSTTVGAAIAVSQHGTDYDLKTTITGGTFEGIRALYEEDLQNEEATDKISLLVTGGTFNGEIKSENCTKFITGGTFHDASVFEYLANGASVALGKDLNITQAITIPVGITATIDLKGFDVTASNTDAFEVAGTLTINDAKNEGVVSAGSAHPAASVCAVWANGGNVTINGGHYQVYSDANGKRNDCIYAGYNADNNNTAGNITINGGKFEYVWPDSKNYANEYNGDWFLLNCADKDLYQTLITVNGGEFKNNAPSYEDVTPSGRTDKEVKLGTSKAVYNDNNVVTTAHAHGTASDDTWYTVK